MLLAAGVEATRGRPGPARRVVQFRTRETVVNAISPTPCNEDLAVGQQGCRVKSAAGVEAARGSPGPARRIVQFRTCESHASAIGTHCNEDPAVGQ